MYLAVKYENGSTVKYMHNYTKGCVMQGYKNRFISVVAISFVDLVVTLVFISLFQIYENESLMLFEHQDLLVCNWTHPFWGTTVGGCPSLNVN